MNRKCQVCFQCSPAEHFVGEWCGHCIQEVRDGRTKYCSGCRQDLPRNRAFYHNRTKKGGRETYCKYCMKHGLTFYVRQRNWDEIYEEAIYNLSNELRWSEVCDLLNLETTAHQNKVAERVQDRMGFDPRQQSYKEYLLED